MTSPDVRVTVPEVRGPLPTSDDSYPFSTMRRAVRPFDVADHGYVEQEFLLSGNAQVYDLVEGRVHVVHPPVRYVNRVLVRRPADPGRADGVVWVDILNASNGYDVEDHWRRAWDHWMPRGATYVGVTSKPVNVEALKLFDPDRYADLTWDLDPATRRRPVAAGEAGWDPFRLVEGAEEGLVWDIISQVGALLRDPATAPLLGGIVPRQVLLTGQSQSAVYLNTWIHHLHDAVTEVAGRHLFDGYLATVGSTLERPLRQRPSTTGWFAAHPGTARDVDVPVVTITAEGDVDLLRGIAPHPILRPGSADGPLRRHYQVAGTPHSDLRAPVVPAPAEVQRAGRVPRALPREVLDRLNVVPLEPVVTGAMDALVAWTSTGAEPPPSVYLARATDHELARDENGNALGGLRYGLVEQPLGTYTGSVGGDVYGVITPFPAELLRRRYGTLERYLELCDRHDDALQAAGYLSDTGRRQLRAAAREIWTRAVPG